MMRERMKAKEKCSREASQEALETSINVPLVMYQVSKVVDEVQRVIAGADKSAGEVQMVSTTALPSAERMADVC